eukprot:364888-Chlamydomonas_euryale.AAC.9
MLASRGCPARRGAPSVFAVTRMLPVLFVEGRGGKAGGMLREGRLRRRATGEEAGEEADSGLVYQKGRHDSSTPYSRQCWPRYSPRMPRSTHAQVHARAGQCESEVAADNQYGCANGRMI